MEGNQVTVLVLEPFLMVALAVPCSSSTLQVGVCVALLCQACGRTVHQFPQVQKDPLLVCEIQKGMQ